MVKPKSEVSLRDAEPADVDRLLELNEAAVPAVNSVPFSQMVWFLDQAHADRGCCLVARVDEDVVGFLVGLFPGTGYASVNYRWFEARWNDFVYVDRVVVDPGFARRGIASSFYRRLGEVAGERASRMTCEVNLRPPNPGSMEFHRALGFAEVGRQEIEGGAREVCMLAARLDPSLPG